MMSSVPPFTIHTSPNAMRFVFTSSWRHSKHYQAVFNSQKDIVPRLMPLEAPWAMITDWRGWLVQVPECERLCIRCLDGHMKQGMRHYAVVIDEHPVTRWQVNKVQEAFPDLQCGFFDSEAEALAWLNEKGYNTDFQPLEFNEDWLKMSEEFKDIVYSLSEVQPSAFGLPNINQEE